MGFTLTQDGNTVAGTSSISDSMRNMMGTGTMQGTMTGNTLTFHMTVASGGFAGAMGPCSMGLDGSGDISGDGRTMTGTYTGSMSGIDVADAGVRKYDEQWPLHADPLALPVSDSTDRLQR
jgi:hypothetical protein